MTRLAACLGFGCFALLLTSAWGQTPAPQADPADYGLLLPKGDVEAQPVDDLRVLVPAEAGGAPVVGLGKVRVADTLVVMLPDGRLTSLKEREATPTDRPFEPPTPAALAKQLAARFPGFKTRTTRRFVYVYNTSEPFYTATSRILETMYPNLLAYCKRQKLPVHDPQVPLVVIMFNTEQEFQQYQTMPESVAAYYSPVSNHVVMYEKSSLSADAPDLAAKQVISTIAHEGVHQILHNIGVQHRLSFWPMWLCEGLPEYFAPTTVDQRVRWKGVGLPHDLRLMDLQDFIGQQAAFGEQGLIGETVSAAQLTTEGYAAAWALTHFLIQQRPKQFFAYLTEVSTRAPLDRWTAEQERELFRKHFGDDWAALEKPLAAHLKRMPYVDPIANQTHFVGMLEVPLGAVIQRKVAITTSPQEIEKWRNDQLAEVPLQVRAGAKLAIERLPNRHSAETFAQGWIRSR